MPKSSAGWQGSSRARSLPKNLEELDGLTLMSQEEEEEEEEEGEMLPREEEEEGEMLPGQEEEEEEEGEMVPGQQQEEEEEEGEMLPGQEEEEEEEEGEMLPGEQQQEEEEEEDLLILGFLNVKKKRTEVSSSCTKTPVDFSHLELRIQVLPVLRSVESEGVTTGDKSLTRADS
ncbi:hypothetical protein TURU_092221 [Turdus rufiventris]|nr:hypothetical protein TURU_092221 [Turdus rufiventris]